MGWFAIFRIQGSQRGFEVLSRRIYPWRGKKVMDLEILPERHVKLVLKGGQVENICGLWYGLGLVVA